eukprot:scaffold104840_cov53-Attheya_sp.AAC.1
MDSSENGMSSFCLEGGMLTNENVDVAVDNVRFVHPSVTAHCDVIQQQDKQKHNPNLLLFIYGSPIEKPQQLYSALNQTSLDLWKQKCHERELQTEFTSTSVADENDDASANGTFTVGTYI